ncbi:MAG: TRAP transporter small permease subunit [Paracoccus sp. (in: a-proteobacteria)]|uniref:TRAP transporter small permease subunit n=1 Tax=Paracoccus sp. TaxID=267 RepID=UPI0026E0EB08|nr:TRAP transporter small permease subunit [Paracoccus sp. (in: a-proteobacteria)]MDO5622939.1 TRAP transporter small permease subunit [Paracoccus sp. (in: a-proteobacteria)]
MTDVRPAALPRPIAAFVASITAINRALFRLAGLAILLIVPLLLYAVVTRYVFNAPSSWAMELGVLIFGPYFLLGGPYLLHTGGHVSLDLVSRAVRPEVNRLFLLVNYPIIMAFCGILLAYAWPFAVDSFAYRETSYSTWNPPVWPVKFAIPLALALMGLQALAEWLRVLFRDPSIPSTHVDEAAL